MPQPHKNDFFNDDSSAQPTVHCHCAERSGVVLLSGRARRRSCAGRRRGSQEPAPRRRHRWRHRRSGPCRCPGSPHRRDPHRRPDSPPTQPSTTPPGVASTKIPPLVHPPAARSYPGRPAFSFVACAFWLTHGAETAHFPSDRPAPRGAYQKSKKAGPLPGGPAFTSKRRATLARPVPGLIRRPRLRGSLALSPVPGTHRFMRILLGAPADRRRAAPPRPSTRRRGLACRV